MKTIKQWFEEYPDPEIRAKLLANLDQANEERANRLVAFFEDALNEGFLWGDSIEGRESSPEEGEAFWEAVLDRGPCTGGDPSNRNMKRFPDVLWKEAWAAEQEDDKPELAMRAGTREAALLEALAELKAALTRQADIIGDEQRRAADLYDELRLVTVAKDKAMAALKRLAAVTDSEYPESDERHPDNDGTNELIKELEEVP